MHFDASVESMTFLHRSWFDDPGQRRGSTIGTSGNDNSASALNSFLQNLVFKKFNLQMFENWILKQLGISSKFFFKHNET